MRAAAGGGRGEFIAEQEEDPLRVRQLNSDQIRR